MQQREDFFVVHRWMGDVLGLKKADRTVFAILWGFCQGGNTYRGRSSYIAELAEITRSTLFVTYSKLEEMGYIERYGDPTEISISQKVHDILNGEGVRLKKSENRTTPVRKSDTTSPKIGLPQSENRTPIIRNSNKGYNNIENNDDKGEAPTRPPHAVVAVALKSPNGYDTKTVAAEYCKAYLADKMAVEAARMSMRPALNDEQFKEALRDFYTRKVAEGASWASEFEFRRNFLNWLPGWKGRKSVGVAYVRPEDAGGYKRPN